MHTLVMKFGGAAVASPEHFSSIADIILERFKEYQRLIVVVSAMANKTDELIALAKRVNPNPPKREYDMLVTVGERISMSLLAMALAGKNCEAMSFTGSQSGIITCGNHADARIMDVRPHRILPYLDSGKVVIVAGFQGVSQAGEITTLGRGGSDTTAAALGIAFGAKTVEFFKDVPGIFEHDPKINPQSIMLKRLTYNQAIDIVSKGAKVLHPRCIELASRNGTVLHVRSFNAKQETGTLIFDDVPLRLEKPVYEN